MEMDESKERKIIIARIAVAVIVSLLAFALGANKYLSIALTILAYIICGADIVIGAVKSLFGGEGFDEKVLMTIATIGAFILGENFEAIAVMVFYQIGELFGDYSIDKSRDSIKSLIDIVPSVANVYQNGEIKKVKPVKVNIGDVLVVNPFEKIPLDGEIIEGATLLNTSALTGESIPRYVSVGDTVASGLLNDDKAIKIKVTKEFKDSTATKIIDLIENATEKKSKSENYITSFAKVYTPIVCLISLFTFLLPVGYNYLIAKKSVDVITFAYRALTVLVISCPCAILISVPLAFFSSVGAASKLGILVKGTNYIEALSKVKTFVFDKTGTMTKGVFEVVGVHHNEMSEEELFKYASHVEYFSNHPIAKSILKYYGKNVDANLVNDVKEIGGRGLSGNVSGKSVLLGNEKLMKDNGIDFKDCSHTGTIVHVAIDGRYEGHILIKDIVKENAKGTLARLKKLGAKENIMLTGDRDSIANEVANEIGIDRYYSELLPNDKLDKVEEFIKDRSIAFVGDGINDAPCITRSDVGIAMGAIGSDSAIDLADIVLVDDNIENVARAYGLSKKTMMVVFENVFCSIGIKVLVLILSIVGISNMWLATFSDVGVMVLAVLNSVRLLSIKKIKL